MTTGPTAQVGTRRLGWPWIVVLTALLLVLGGLRFGGVDRAGTGVFNRYKYFTYPTEEGRVIENLNIDVTQYLAMIDDYRGVPDAFEKATPYPEFAETDNEILREEGPVAPFIYRPALPWVASMLPLSTPDAFAALNLGLLVVGLWCLLDALFRQRCPPRTQLIGGALYVIALPVVVFGSSLFIDSGTLGVLMILYWMLARRWWFALVLLLPLSFMVKESLLILAPVAAAAWWADGRSFRDRRFLSGAAASAGLLVVAIWLTRALAPDPVYSFDVSPKLSYLGGNLSNVVSTAFFIVGSAPVMVPAALAAFALLRPPIDRAAVTPRVPDLVGVGVVLLLNIYSLVSTDLTMRTMWLIWPFAIALGAPWLDEFLDQFNPSIRSAPS